MNEKIRIELGSVQTTLLLPLWGRVQVSLKNILCWLINQLWNKYVPLFKNSKKGFSFKNKIAVVISDHYKIMSWVHLQV